MQVFVQDIRDWGNKKIMSSFTQSKDGEQAFIERLRIQNMLLIDCTNTAYSFPKLYSALYDKIKTKYYGMPYFMSFCEPLIQSMDKPDKSVQRRFRNQWDACWGSFGRSLMLSTEILKTLKDLGIRICFAWNFDRIPDEVFRFYNTVLKWYVYTVSESSIQELGFTPSELVEQMILKKADMFVHDIQVGWT